MLRYLKDKMRKRGDVAVEIEPLWNGGSCD